METFSSKLCLNVKHQRFIFQHTVQIRNDIWAEIRIRYGGAISCSSVDRTAASIVFADIIQKLAYIWDKCINEFGRCVKNKVKH